jgi:hypothetical protein
MDLLFIILCIIHTVIWAFIMFAFINPTTAYYNVYYIIPLVYLVQILPFHIIVSLKKKIYENDNIRKEQEKEVSKYLIIPYLFMQAREFFNKFSFFNPLSPQGMLIFGLITSIYRLKK